MTRITRSQSDIFKFINKFMEKLPYEVMFIILEQIPMSHLVTFLSFYHLPILRQFVITLYFRQRIILNLDSSTYPKVPIQYEVEDLDQNGESNCIRYSYDGNSPFIGIHDKYEYDYEDGDVTNTKVFNSTHTNKYHPYFLSKESFNQHKKNTLGKPHKVLNSICFKNKQVIDKILSYEDLIFREIHIISTASTYFGLLKRDSSKSIINNSEMVLLTLTNGEGLYCRETDVKLNKNENNFNVKLQYHSVCAIGKTNLVELNINCEIPKTIWNHMEHDHILGKESSLRLGNNLKRLSITHMSYFPVHIIEFPKGLQQLTVKKVQFDPYSLIRCSLPSSIIYLNLTDCLLNSYYCIFVLISNKLPNLKHFILSDKFYKTKRSEKIFKEVLGMLNLVNQFSWPKGLETIELDSVLENEHMNILENTKWPQNLKKLTIAISSAYEYISNQINDLPESLIELKIVKPLQGKTERAIAPTYFPQNLQRLVLYGLSFNYTLTSLPDTLIDLNIKQCTRIQFPVLRFPSKLKYLSIENCQLTNLNEYQYWEDLQELKYLSLHSNGIYSLTYWIPPPNLTYLILTYNRIRYITSECLIFSEHSTTLLPHLVGLYLLGNGFRSYPTDIILPGNVDPNTILASLPYRNDDK
ncbi:hypothetical protein DFJ63DRAFT_315553 [Scheffersomyces coipomensis]|uniref:uncharacterized protein n=1 Tax=Scheffersomyces coipomensis TaxID=1788519 RepID=UPI00315C8D73